MGLTAEQKAIAQQIVKIGKKRGASEKEIKSALETGLVESNLRNLSGGDADSAGWRQERASLYKDPTNLNASINRYYNETHAVANKYGSAGALAAAVQRPAAQYRGRYQEASSRADQLLGGLGSNSGAASVGSVSASPTASGIGGDAKKQLLLAYLSQRGDPNALLSLASGLQAAGGTSTPTSAAAPSSTAVTSVPSGNGAQAALSWATSKVGKASSRETGTNSGGLSSYANKRFGFHNAPWCAMFTSLAVTKGGAPSSARTASVAAVRSKAQAGQGYERGFVNPKAAKPGDLILFGNDHIGLVQSVSGGQIHYVGGNQSNSVTEASVPVGKGDIVRPKYGSR